MNFPRLTGADLEGAANSHSWPMPHDYMSAVQHPSQNFASSDLRVGGPVLNRRGLPQVEVGEFACVFKLRVGSRNFAIRCFLTPRSDRLRRYSLLSEYVRQASITMLANCEYFERGIRVGGKWFPIVKMDWVKGQTLDTFINNHLNDPLSLRRLASKWRRVMQALRQADIAHGDLQHGNVLVDDTGEVQLVDYDAMYIPKLRSAESPEIGHPNYQHPQRSSLHYDVTIDNFSAHVIYISILGIAMEPALWHDFYNENNLILTRKDFEEPSQSRALCRLQQSSDQQVVGRLANYMQQFCLGTLESVPTLEDSIKGSVAPPPSPIIRIDCPRSGAELVLGEELMVNWTFVNIGGFVEIELLRAGQLSATIVSSTPIGRRGSGSYRYVVPPTILPGNDYSVRITGVSGAQHSVVMSGVFAITETSKPTLRMITPNGGEEWEPAMPQTISWIFTGVSGDVKIELLKGTELFATITASTPIGKGGAGDYRWVIPRGYDGGNRYAVKISSNGDPTCVAISRNYFTIMSKELRRTLDFFDRAWDCSRCWRFFNQLWVCPHPIQRLRPYCDWGKKEILSEDERRNCLNNDYYWYRISQAVQDFWR